MKIKMENRLFTVIKEDFSDFNIGEFPYDKDHSALGEYHYVIPEGYRGNFYDPIVSGGEYLGYLHCSENDRGVPGTGHVNWEEIFKGLTRIHYHGWIGIETFYAPINFIPIASSVWRQLSANVDDVPKQGIQFLRKKIEEFGLN